LALLAAWLAGPGDGRAQSPGCADGGWVVLPKSAAVGPRHLKPDCLHCQLRQRWQAGLGPRTGAAHYRGVDGHDHGDLHRSRRSSPRQRHNTGRVVGRRPPGARRVEQSGSRHQRRGRNTGKPDDLRWRECLVGAQRRQRGAKRQQTSCTPIPVEPTATFRSTCRSVGRRKSSPTAALDITSDVRSGSSLRPRSTPLRSFGPA